MKKDLEDYFIPNERNKYAPHGLQKAAMVGMLFLVILSFTATNALSLLWISSQWMISTVLPAVIVDLTNEERGELPTLKRSAVLDRAAQLKAQDMAKNEYFAHHSPDGVSPWYWFNQVSYNFVHAGENLAIHFTDSSEVVDAWMKSPSHKANIMNGNYTEIGVGTAEGSYEGHQTVYVVQLFGTPAAPTPDVEEEPEVIEIATAIEEEEPEEEVLSESVSITEDVEVIEAEPIATEVEETVIVQNEVESTTTPASSSDVAMFGTEGTEVVDMEVTNTGIALYSDFMSTSTGKEAASATAGTTEEVTGNQAPFFLELATQPHKILQILYIIIGLFVLVSLLISIFIEIRHQQPVQIAYGFGLMTLMVCLFYIHNVLSSGAFIM